MKLREFAEERNWNQFLFENVVKFQKVFKKQAGILKKQI